MGNCNSSNKSMEEKVKKILDKLRDENSILFFLHSQNEKISIKIDKVNEIIEGIPTRVFYKIQLNLKSKNINGYTETENIKSFLNKLKKDQDRLKAKLIFHMV